MRLASYVLSVVLHATLFLAIFFWPSPRLIKLDSPPVLISLVDGAPGGNRAPSPVLGPQGAAGSKIAPSMPAPQQKDVAPAVPDTVATPVAQPKEEPKKPEPKPQPKPKEPEPQATPIAEKKEPKKPEPKPEEPKKPEPKPEEPKKPEPPKKEDKKPEPPKKDDKPAKAAQPVDPVKAALETARAAASRENAPNRGNAVARALAEAKRNAGGFGGGGGGEGDGPGGGGLLDTYMGQVMMAVQANWGYVSPSRTSLVCAVRVRVDASGKVLQAQVERSSGNAQFDATTVNAIIRTGATGQFPPPPNPDYYDMVLAFNSTEMMGR